MSYNLPKFDLTDPEKVYQDITNKPILLSYFYLYLFRNFKDLNFSYFSNNIKLLHKKINSISQKKNFDKYISLSCIFGAFLGDSLGGHCEFMESSQFNHQRIYTNERFKNGQTTDDSEMALAKAFAIMDMKDINNLDQNLIFYYYGIWIMSMPLEKKIASQNCNSKANGGLMRISTLIVWYYYKNKNEIKNILKTDNKTKFLELYNNIYLEVKKDFEITHPNKENIVSGALLTFMTLCTMNLFSGEDTIKKLLILLENDIFNTSSDENVLKLLVTNTLKEVNSDNFDKYQHFKHVFQNMGYYAHAFKLCIYYLTVIDKRRKIEENIFIRIIEEICDYGGDTDTNAAIVGTVIGPMIGYTNFTNDKLFENLILFFNPNRLIYSSSFIYFFVEYLDNCFNGKNLGNNNGIKFNTLKMILDMLSKNLN